MDHRRFDSLARFLAARTSRRNLAAAAVLVAPSIVGRNDLEARKGKNRCKELTKKCDKGIDCCRSLVCQAKLPNALACAHPAGKYCCKVATKSCATDSDCCGPLRAGVPGRRCPAVNLLVGGSPAFECFR